MLSVTACGARWRHTDHPVRMAATSRTMVSVVRQLMRARSREQGREPALRGEHEVAEFAGRAFAAARHAVPVRMLQGPGMRVARCRGEAGFAHHGDVSEVVAHEGDLVHSDSMLQGELAHEWELVADAVVGLDAEIGGAARGRVSGARGDECD